MALAADPEVPYASTSQQISSRKPTFSASGLRSVSVSALFSAAAKAEMAPDPGHTTSESVRPSKRLSRDHTVDVAVPAQSVATVKISTEKSRSLMQLIGAGKTGQLPSGEKPAPANIGANSISGSGLKEFTATSSSSKPRQKKGSGNSRISLASRMPLLGVPPKPDRAALSIEANVRFNYVSLSHLFNKEMCQ